MSRRLTYRRRNHHDIHVRASKDEGTTRAPSDIVVLNDLDRFQLVIGVTNHVPGLGSKPAHLPQRMRDERVCCRAHTRQEDEDPPEVEGWNWPHP